MSIFTRAFWLAAAERAVKTGAQFGVVVMAQDWAGIEVFRATLANVAGSFLAGAVFSVLTSVASAQVGVRGSPSLAPAAEVEAATPPP